jgi:hypothetical protein
MAEFFEVFHVGVTPALVAQLPAGTQMRQEEQSALPDQVRLGVAALLGIAGVMDLVDLPMPSREEVPQGFEQQRDRFRGPSLLFLPPTRLYSGVGFCALALFLFSVTWR